MKNNFIALLICLTLSNLVWGYNDPTRPPNAQEAEKNQPLLLTAIFTFSDKVIAIINGQTLKKGDRINEFTISTIGEDTVELTGPNNSKEILYLLPTVKKPFISRTME